MNSSAPTPSPRQGRSRSPRRPGRCRAGRRRRRCPAEPGRQEGQGDEDAAGGDERDHVPDAGHQPPPHVGRHRLPAQRRPGPPVPVAPRRRRRAQRRRQGSGGGQPPPAAGDVASRLRRRGHTGVPAAWPARWPAATACSSRPGASVMARRTPTLTVGLPAKRSRSRTSTSAARMTASAAAIVLGRERAHPGGALGLDRDLVPGRAGALLQRLGGHVGVGDPRRARRDRDQPHGLTTSLWTMSTTVAASGASSRARRKSGRVRRRARVARTLRWSSSRPSGPAMRKTSVAGPVLGAPVDALRWPGRRPARPR